jgi:hypothetical protein
MCPAIFFARSSTPSEATWMALPAVCSERDPNVPEPRGTRAVSELTSVILSIGMPSTSLASIANAVAWPWPCTLVPANTVAEPSAFTSQAPHSMCRPTGAVTSTYVDRPMPSCLTAPEERRAACSARSCS